MRKLRYTVGSVHHLKHGIVTLVRNDLTTNLIESSFEDSKKQWLTISVNDDLTTTQYLQTSKNTVCKDHNP